MFDLLVRGGTVVTEHGVMVADVAVSGEQIAAIGLPGSLGGDAVKVIDAADQLVLPGGVDPHVHYNLRFGDVRSEPQSFTPAAALGGTTTIIDFALQEPSGSLHEAVAAKRAEADGHCAVDYGLHAIVAGPDVSLDVIDELGDVIANGVPTIKAFMTYGWIVDDGQLYGIMAEVARHGGMSLVHAEDDAIARWMTRRYLRVGRTHGAYISETRNALVEEAAVRRAVLLAERTGCPLYVLHMAAGTAVAALDEGRRRGLPLHGETLVTYLSFTADDLWGHDGRGLLWNNYPTPKRPEDHDVLWSAVVDGRLATVASDHFATTALDHFERMGTTIEGMMAGHASVELRVPVLYDLGVRSGRLSLERFVELVSTGPARLMGLYPRKGALAVGSDADIAVLDPHRSWTVTAEDLHSSSDYTCWEGWELRGKVVATVLRGTVIVEKERFVGAPGGGRFLPRTLDRHARGHHV